METFDAQNAQVYQVQIRRTGKRKWEPYKNCFTKAQRNAVLRQQRFEEYPIIDVRWRIKVVGAGEWHHTYPVQLCLLD